MRDKVYEFGSFRLNVGERRFERNDEVVQLSPKVFEVLVALVQGEGKLVTYAELMETVWPDTAVEEGNLRFCIHNLRKELGGDAIETIAKHGYRFGLPVKIAAFRSNGNGNGHVPAVRDERSEPDARESAGKPYQRTIFLGASLLLILFAGLAAISWTFRSSRSRSVPARSIAVVPFNMISHDGSNPDAARRGLTEALTFNLKQLSGVTATEFLNLEPYFTRQVDPVQAGKELGVAFVVTGSVRQEEGGHRVNFEVLDVAGGTPIISDSILVERGTDLEAETTAALRIARKVDVSFAASRDEELIPPDTLDDEAKRNFLLAQRLPRENDLNRWAEASQLMQKVVESAPDWALGRAKLAEALMLIQDETTCTAARPEAHRALELDANSAEALLVLGLCDADDRDWAQAEDKFRRAVTISPKYSRAHLELGMVLDYQRRFAEGETHIRKALELEPLVPYYNVMACQHYYYDKKWTEALRFCEQSERIEQGYFMTVKRLYWIYVMQGRWDKVSEVTFGKRSNEENLRDPLSRPLVNGDVRGFWEANLNDRLANKSKRQSPMAVATYYSMLGNAERAFPLIEQAIAENSIQVRYLYADPIWDNLRSDPRYKQMVNALGLSPASETAEPSRKPEL